VCAAIGFWVSNKMPLWCVFNRRQHRTSSAHFAEVSEGRSRLNTIWCDSKKG
jgi:hypothetical protein